MNSKWLAPSRYVILDIPPIGLATADAALIFGQANSIDVAVAAIAVVGLCLRRLAPYLVFTATLPALFIGVAVIAALVALYTVAEKRPNRYALTACAATVFVWFRFWETTPSTSRLLDVVYAILWTGAPVLLGLLMRARADLSTKLAEIDHARRHEQEMLVDNALASERTHLSREMHDVVSHQVSLIAVQAGALQVTANDDATARTARTIRSLSVQTLDELRLMVGVLRASGNEMMALTPQPGIEDVESLVVMSGVETTVHSWYDPSVKPSAAVQRAIYRAVQEGLTNIAKHAPGATASLDLHIDTQQVNLTLANTRPMRTPDRLPSDHYGLLGLRERAELLGGSLRAEHLADGGYRLSIFLPVHA